MPRAGSTDHSKDWPEDHKWDLDWNNVNCRGCLASYETFTIADDGKSITCKRCKLTSYNPTDVAMHYCANCHVFHDDIWPPAEALVGVRPTPQIRGSRYVHGNNE